MIWPSRNEGCAAPFRRSVRQLYQKLYLEEDYKPFPDDFLILGHEETGEVLNAAPWGGNIEAGAPPKLSFEERREEATC